MAGECKALQNFVHVSTAYVNSDRRGEIKEEIYETDQDPEEMINNLISMNPKDLIAKTKTLLGKLPNTYTFTKAASERMIKKKRPKYLTVSIVRPSIIGAAFRDPYAGWVENITASSAVFLLGGIGMIKYMPGKARKVADMIPVDFVADQTIVVAAMMANTKNLHVFHSTTSHKNPTTVGFSNKTVHLYFTNNVPLKIIAKCNVSLVPNKHAIKIL